MEARFFPEMARQLHRPHKKNIIVEFTISIPETSMSIPTNQHQHSGFCISIPETSISIPPYGGSTISCRSDHLHHVYIPLPQKQGITNAEVMPCFRNVVLSADFARVCTHAKWTINGSWMLCKRKVDLSIFAQWQASDITSLLIGLWTSHVMYSIGS